MGVIQFGLGIVTISLTSLFEATSALPLPLALALVIGPCPALACHRFVARPTLKRS
jgi:hypothetical protein